MSVSLQSVSLISWEHLTQVDFGCSFCFSSLMIGNWITKANSCPVDAYALMRSNPKKNINSS